MVVVAGEQYTTEKGGEKKNNAAGLYFHQIEDADDTITKASEASSVIRGWKFRMQSKTEKEERVCVWVKPKKKGMMHTHTPERERVYYSSLYLVISEEKRETKTKNSFHPSNFLFFPLCHWQPSDSLDDSTR